MNARTDLRGSQLRAYDAIFQHPISHNLLWREVLSMFTRLGEVVEESNGSLRISRNGHTLILRRPSSKDIPSADEVVSLRHFLEESEAISRTADSRAAHWLLVIDHHEARIFRSESHGTLPIRILPVEYFRHARHSQDFSSGKEKPDATVFFKPVAAALHAAAQILVFGTGTGSSNEMDQFISWMDKNHPEMAKRIIGSVVVDEHQLTDDLLLARAREFYGAASTSKTDRGNETAPVPKTLT